MGLNSPEHRLECHVGYQSQERNDTCGVTFLAGMRASELAQYPNIPWNDTMQSIHVITPQPNASEFALNMAHSRVMIGIGDPLTSPTPYVALGLGVPVILPVSSTNPTKRF